MKKLVQNIFMLLLLAIPPGLLAQMTDVIFSEYGEGSGYNKYLEIYNGTGEDMDLTEYFIWKITNEGEWWENSFPLKGIHLKHGETYTIVHPDADSALLVYADTIGPVLPGVFILFNGNEAFALVKAVAPGDTVFVDVIGEESPTVSPANWAVAGVDGAGAEHTWVRKKTVSGPNNNWASSAGTNADDSEWIVYPQNYWDNVGFHSEINSGFASDIFFSEYGEGTDNNRYLEIYNGTGQDVDLSNYVLWKILNGGTWYYQRFPIEGILPHGSTFNVVNYKADSVLAIRRDTVGPINPTFCTFNGNEAFAIAKILAPGDTVRLDVIGMESDPDPAVWDVAGVVGAAVEHTLIRKRTVCGPNADWLSSAGTNTEDSEWIVYPQNYWEDFDKHSMYCGPASLYAAVTFQVDMNQTTVAAEGVHIAGAFQDWNPGATLMDDTDGDGIWTITLNLEQNQTYEYKFVNGDAWGEDEGVPSECASNNNRYVAVGEADMELPVVCYASCYECAGVYNVTFKVDMNEQTVSADGVHLAGGFQGWDPSATLMDDSDSDGIYEVTLELGGNSSYQYKFVNGNAWGFDEAVPAECAVSNNREVEVATEDLVLDAVCFGECTLCNTGINEFPDLNDLFRVVPNPSNGHFMVIGQLNDERQMTVSVYNVVGQLIDNRSVSLQKGENTLDFDLNEAGLYIIEFMDNNGKFFLKAMIN